MKLGLGTAQLGLAYGISNNMGQPGREEVRRILAAAAEYGVRILDTAPEYGDSEERIGSLRPTGLPSFDIVTKTRILPSDVAEDAVPAYLTAGVKESLRRLQTDSVHGLLVHHSSDLLGSRGAVLWRCLSDLREAGLVKKIGVSVYSGAEIDSVLNRHPIDLIQVPVSVLDQRLVVSGHLQRLQERGVEVHARSVLLQGVLLMEPDELPAEVAGLRGDVQRFRDFAAAHGNSPLEAALGFVRGVDELDVAFCGVASAVQMSELVEACRANVDAGGMHVLAAQDTLLLDPSRWSEVKA